MHLSDCPLLDTASSLRSPPELFDLILESACAIPLQASTPDMLAKPAVPCLSIGSWALTLSCLPACVAPSACSARHHDMGYCPSSGCVAGRVCNPSGVFCSGSQAHHIASGLVHEEARASSPHREPKMGSHQLYPVAEHNLTSGAQYFPLSGLLFGMDYSAWPPENTFQAELGDLNLLEPPAPQAAAGDALFSLQGELRPSVEEERVAKRSREAIERESLESFLRELAKEPAEPGRSEPHQSSSGDEKRAAGRHSSDAAAAARAKAGRERARRERLNEVCHLTLGHVCCQCLVGGADAPCRPPHVPL